MSTNYLCQPFHHHFLDNKPLKAILLLTTDLPKIQLLEMAMSISNFLEKYCMEIIFANLKLSHLIFWKMNQICLKALTHLLKVKSFLLIAHSSVPSTALPNHPSAILTSTSKDSIPSLESIISNLTQLVLRNICLFLRKS